MAVQGKESTQKEFKKYTGRALWKVLAVNPTVQELKDKFNIENPKEPEYIKEVEIDVDGVKKKTKQLRIEFWLQSTDFYKNQRSKVAFFITYAHSKSAAGNTQYVNKYGKTVWSKDEEGLDTNEYYWNHDSRKALKGEEEFYGFLASWLNTSQPNPEKNKEGDECRIDDWKTVFTGDFSQLKELVDNFPNNQVYALQGINDKGYTTIFTGKFDRAYQQTPTQEHWDKKLGGQYPWNCDFQNSLEWKEYNGSMPSSDTPEESVASNDVSDLEDLL